MVDEIRVTRYGEEQGFEHVDSPYIERSKPACIHAAQKIPLQPNFYIFHHTFQPSASRT